MNAPPPSTVELSSNSPNSSSSFCEGKLVKNRRNRSHAICCVPGCSSRKEKCSILSFHFFPSERSENGFDRRKVWESVLKLDKPISPHMQVCSLHFRKSDFYLPAYPTKRPRLQVFAVPSQNLPVSDDPNFMENRNLLLSSIDDPVFMENKMITADLSQNRYDSTMSQRKSRKRSRKEGGRLYLSARRKKNKGQNFPWYRKRKEGNLVITQASENSVEEQVECAPSPDDLSLLLEIKEENEESLKDESGEEMIEGRRIIKLLHFIDCLKQLNCHSNLGCNFSDMLLIGEQRRGLNSGLTFLCGVCRKQETVWTDGESTFPNMMDVNAAAVMGSTNIPIGHSNLDVLLKSMDIPCMSQNTFLEENVKLSNVCINTNYSNRNDGS